jgi:hypothetical protein
MDFEAAKTELLRHSGCAENSYDDGFVGCLRPFIGLREGNFHQVIEAVLSVGTEFASSITVERSIAESVLGITVYGRRWGVDEDGMLVRNHLITPDDRQRLRNWVEIIETIMMGLLAGHSPAMTIHAYCEYVATCGWGDNYSFFLPIVAAAIDCDELGDYLQGHCAAIAKLGRPALSVADALIRSKTRDYSWYEPNERCAAEMQMHIDNALNGIGIVH